MSSKKKKRHQAYLERQKKIEDRKIRKKKLDDTMQNGTIEEMAEAMGIKLK